MKPFIINQTADSISIGWNPIRFCGVESPNMLNSITYTIEIAEGVEFRDSKMDKYINDMSASEYYPIYQSNSELSTEIPSLKPSTWYHIRLCIDYFGFKVVSDATSVNTLKGVPSPPGLPKVTVIPVRSSFDIKSEIPARYDLQVSWTPSMPNGSIIERYQVLMQRLDVLDNPILTEPPLIRKKKEKPANSPQKTIALMVKSTPKCNQWIQSPGKSEIQLKNSLKTRGRTPFSDSFAEPSTFNESSSHFRIKYSNWIVVFENINRSLRFYSPPEGDYQWKIKVRARNSSGWSPFSEVLLINNRTFPSLFPKRPSLLNKSTSSNDGAEDMDKLIRSSSFNEGSFSNNNNKNHSFDRGISGSFNVPEVQDQQGELYWDHRPHHISPQNQPHIHPQDQSSSHHQSNQNNSYRPEDLSANKSNNKIFSNQNTQPEKHKSLPKINTKR